MFPDKKSDEQEKNTEAGRIRRSLDMLGHTSSKSAFGAVGQSSKHSHTKDNQARKEEHTHISPMGQTSPIIANNIFPKPTSGVNRADSGHQEETKQEFSWLAPSTWF